MSKYPGFGTVLEWDPAGGSSFSAIGQIMDISGPSLSRNTLDSTTHDSTDAWMEFLKSLKDGGEVTFDIVYDPALSNHDATTGLLSDFAEDSTIANFRITFPDTGNTQWVMPAIVSGFEPTAPVAEKLTSSVTLKIAGKPTLA